MSNQMYYFSHEQFLTMVNDKLQIPNQEENVIELITDYMFKKKGTWTIALEQILEKLILLQIKNKTITNIKDVLLMYRKVTQNHQNESLKKVLIFLRTEVERNFKKNEKNVSLKDFQSMQDIEIDTPMHNIILLEVGNQKTKEQYRKLRFFLKQVWETYKTIIETIKFNNKLEDVHLSTIEKCLVFCEKYQRKQELHRFIESIKLTLSQLLMKDSKFQNQIEINNEESNATWFEIRLVCAKYLNRQGMFQDSFQMLSDAQNILQYRKLSKKLKQQFQLEYYQYISETLEQSKQYLYHAYFTYLYLNILKTKHEDKDVKQKMVQETIDKLILSVLSISENDEQDRNRVNMGQMVLYGAKVIPSKKEIIYLIKNQNLIVLASSNISAFYTLLQEKFNLHLYSSTILPQLQQLNIDNSKQQDIQNTLIQMVLIEVSKTFKNVKVSYLQKLLPNYAISQIFQYLLLLNNNNNIKCSIDQQKQFVHFVKQQKITYSKQLISVISNVKIINQQLQDKQYLNKFLLETYYQENVTKKMQAHLEYKQRLKIEQIEKANQLEQLQQSQAAAKTQKIEEEREKQLEIAMRIQEIQKGELKQKHQKVKEILKLKGGKQIVLMDKKLEHLNDQDLEEIEYDDLCDLKTNTQKKIDAATQKKYKNQFIKTDYIEREKRNLEKAKFEKKTDVEVDTEQIKQDHLKNFDKQIVIADNLQKISEWKQKQFNVQEEERKQQYNEQLMLYKQNLTDMFKKEIVQRAMEMKQKEEERLQRLREEREEMGEEAEPEVIVRGGLFNKAADVKFQEPTGPTGELGDFRKGGTRPKFEETKTSTNDDFRRKNPLPEVPQSTEIKRGAGFQQQQQTTETGGEIKRGGNQQPPKFTGGTTQQPPKFTNNNTDIQRGVKKPEPPKQEIIKKGRQI